MDIELHQTMEQWERIRKTLEELNTTPEEFLEKMKEKIEHSNNDSQNTDKNLTEEEHD